MKLYISVDMEGLAGITNWKDETEDRERFRNAMNEQVEWVLEGISKSKHNKEITHIYMILTAEDRTFPTTGSTTRTKGYGWSAAARVRST